MRIITVSGARSNVGKTSLVSLLAARLPGYGAIKVTITDLFTSVTDDPVTISEEGKDTAVMKGAGADPVVWVRCPVEALSESLSYALNLAAGGKGVIIEGNSPVGLIEPDVAFFVTGADPRDMKPGAAEVLARADVVVVNVDDDSPSDSAEQAVREHNKAAVITTMRRMRAPDEDILAFFSKMD